jgi:hypothetical protein
MLIITDLYIDQIFCQPLIKPQFLINCRSGITVNNLIGYLFWNFYFYFSQITMPIDLMTGAPGESRFLLEDASYFKFY